ncbi:MAG: adenosylcobinamide-GDP ribazoletransferase [Dehalococcoidia bacterium]
MRIAQTLDRVLAPVTLLTSLPVARRVRPGGLPDASYGLFPLVGLLIGALLLALDYVTGLILPNEASSALVVMALVAITGALHLDGLADSADGLFGGRDREQRLAIMSDSRNGAFGFVAVAAVLLLKWAALMALDGWLRGGALLLVPALARWAVLPTVALFPSARSDGMAFQLQRSARWTQAALGSAIAIVVSLAVFWPMGVVLLVPAFLIAIAVGAYATSRIGGVTGDIFGATVELSEAALLLVIATSVSHAWLA